MSQSDGNCSVISVLINTSNDEKSLEKVTTIDKQLHQSGYIYIVLFIDEMRGSLNGSLDGWSKG